jgi:hypothetical protein
MDEQRKMKRLAVPEVFRNRQLILILHVHNDGDKLFLLWFEN